jgi:hypothetical protein
LELRDTRVILDHQVNKGRLDHKVRKGQKVRLVPKVSLDKRDRQETVGRLAHRAREDS